MIRGKFDVLYELHVSALSLKVHAAQLMRNSVEYRIDGMARKARPLFYLSTIGSANTHLKDELALLLQDFFWNVLTHVGSARNEGAAGVIIAPHTWDYCKGSASKTWCIPVHGLKPWCVLMVYGFRCRLQLECRRRRALP